MALDPGSHLCVGMMKLLFNRVRVFGVCLLAVALACPVPVRAYAVLSHEAIIDAVWETHVKPLLLKKFPRATEEDLSRAQAYAYGGAIIQDMGYYPYGSPFFSVLTHYIRSGDFILALLRDAKDLHEYAFAIGALAHYAADNDGHRIGINKAVPILYPSLRKKYGDSVSYADNRLAHVKTEFGFDVLEIARERYAPDSYHDFIGFEVPRPVLDRAFLETYGLELKDVLVNEEKALNSYRRDVSKLIPKATRIAWHLKQDEIKDDIPDATKKKFLFNLSRTNYEQGENTGPGKYGLNDDAHAELLDKLTENKFVAASAEVRAELLQFFAEPDAPYATKRNAKAWAKVQTQLQRLKSATTAPAVVQSSPAASAAPVPQQ